LARLALGRNCDAKTNPRDSQTGGAGDKVQVEEKTMHVLSNLTADGALLCSARNGRVHFASSR
jgi:hypothetical protein